MITPTTKRIGLVCLTILGVSALIGSAVGNITFHDSALIAIPAMTAITGLIDGGK